MATPNHPSHLSFTCPKCFRTCKTAGGLARHIRTVHRDFTPASDDEDVFTSQSHPFLSGKKSTFSTELYLISLLLLSGMPCNEYEEYLPPFTRPPHPVAQANVDDDCWNPFSSRIEFDFAYYHFVEVQNSAAKIDKALNWWTATVMKFGESAPWRNSDELYAAIDAIKEGGAPWKVYRIHYNGPRPPGTPPRWMTETYELCTRDSRQVLHNQLSATKFKDNINVAPYRQLSNKGVRIWSNLMSGDWAWKQAVGQSDSRSVKDLIFFFQDKIAEDPSTHGAMFVPVVVGSDKTIVSVATGHQEYHPVYMSPGNLTNIARRAQGDAVLPVAFLPIPKSTFL